ncbi:restriction endonuclease subunit S [Deinococcus enclensis]|uniref:Type I restriction enzyme S subunit n=1 Tax=Deinococcus enclensis TaxID=1049582 RepID=A0ABT9MD20_9DEIO|nr:restriction endonuclease subunit S [Deinococcus enclensis]MDP9764468.1 type I restriction enzyme S subunit [Deinococcus enclensis]
MQRVKLKTFAAVSGGKRLPKGEEVTDGPSNHRYLRIVDMSEEGVIKEGIKYISQSASQQITRYRIFKDELYISIAGTIGRVGIIDDELSGINLTENAAKINVTADDFLPKYVLYSLRSSDVQKQVKGLVGGAAQPKLGLYKVEELEVIQLPLPTQRKIAAILSAYDDLIENNTRRVRVLEQMARALYREWFVEYRYPGHEQAQWVEDEAGRRPQGWEWVKFTDTAMVLSGGTPKTTEPSFWDGDIPFYTPKDSPDGFYVTSTEKSITQAGLKKCNSRLYPKDTVFITARGTVGNLALASGNMAMNQSCYALDSRAGLGQYFLFLLVEQLVSGLKKQATGAVFDAITVATFEKTQVLKPTKEVLDAFATRVKPLFDASLSLTRRNANLRQTRDLLLPRLVSGELDVSGLRVAGVEGEVEEMAKVKDER